VSDATSIAAPEPELTPDELIARAAALRPMLVERQAEVEERNYYDADVHRVAEERLGVPRERLGQARATSGRAAGQGLAA
jgi:hypothetical protein